MGNNKIVPWMFKVVRQEKGRLAILLCLQTIISIGSVFYTLIIKNTIDCAVIRDEMRFWENVIHVTAVIGMLMILRMLLRYIEEAARSGMENAFKERLFETLLKKKYAQVMSVHSGEWMNRLTSDTVICANNLIEIIPGIVGVMVRLFAAFAVIAVLEPILAMIMFPCGILLLLMTVVIRKRLKQFHKQVQEQDGRLRGYLQEHLWGLLVIRAFGSEKATLLGAKLRFEAHKKARLKKCANSSVCNGLFSVAMNGMYLLGITFCGYGILHGTVSYGTLIAVTQLISQIQSPLANIGGFVPKYYSMLASAERLQEVEKYAEADLKNIRTQEDIELFYRTMFDKIEFKNVTFFYRENEESNKIGKVLDEVNFTIGRGECIAITGVSGSGKSTVLKLLLGLYEPIDGEICVVAYNGEKYPMREFIKLFSYVPQGNYLLSGTIRDMVTFHNEERGRSMTVEKALELACADFVWTLPNGVETILGENGAGLSEGQLQRIAIARALYANTPILILDEATSALDERTERRLLENIREIMDKTIIMVTHRMSLFDICNKKIDMNTIKRRHYG